MPSTSEQIRSEIIHALCLDLVGPDNDHAFAAELLPEPPSRWYLTGFLVPKNAPEEQRCDPTSVEEIDAAGEAGELDDAGTPEKSSARKSFLPSSMGLTVLVAPGVGTLEAKVSWGDYTFEGAADEEPSEEETEAIPTEVAESAPPNTPNTTTAKRLKGYRRIPREESVQLAMPQAGQPPLKFDVPNSGGLKILVTSRDVAAQGAGAHHLPIGTRSASAFLVNERIPKEKHGYRAFAFQTILTLISPEPFVPRSDPRGGQSGTAGDEWDEQVADLQYRDVVEYAVGHGVSATLLTNEHGSCRTVRTIWIPDASVERVAPSSIPDVELGMETLGALVDGADAAAKLMPLVTQYQSWITANQGKTAGFSSPQSTTAAALFSNAKIAAQRIEAGITLLDDPDIIKAFRIANRAMAAAARHRDAAREKKDPAALKPPAWRPFQLAFILMTLKGISDPLHHDREVVDLLFFPTGGGKTEAYLGLAAFTMVLRRLRHPGIRSAGMSVLMRYTLRLLTLDQLGRAAALMCALELEREKDLQHLGEWPFEIGLWVGSAATPNRMGSRGDNGAGYDKTAYTKTRRFLTNSSKSPAPIPIEECPWCGTKFEGTSFRLVPDETRPLNLRVHCVNHLCDFSGQRTLPIVGVDEPIYRRLPAFIIATVDKFAALPWTGQAGTLFGLVDRYDKNGFYGPCEPPDTGSSLGGHLPPPDLIIQDELHLISGPLGTIAGVYETAIDALASRQIDDKTIRPKIIASTATVRRAQPQIRALFERSHVSVFPPPGPDRRDSFFAFTESATVTPARMYIGVAAQGRSLKVVLLRVALAVLSAAQTAYEREGGHGKRINPADPYMTLLGYFNSLRELGGSRRIIEDEVRTRVAQYSRRKRRDPVDDLFVNRDIHYDVLELTSRVSTNDIASTKRRLSVPFWQKDRVDVALATNMISVGLDILRLGLMVVLGQPKTSAEYIQTTSRVGRNPELPGLVITLLNVHKPRDRSHYERFGTYHATFYRSVEATSVTPFSPRALDRALAAALVALCRQGAPVMVPPLGAGQILTQRSTLEKWAERFAERAANHDARLGAVESQRLKDQVLHRCRDLLDAWFTIADVYQQTGTKLQYQLEAGAARRLLYDPLNPDLPTLRPEQRKFRANRSMRDVEPSVDITVRNLNDWRNKP
ncbi:DISARM system helicase DrmA [Oryzomonas rubra]|uniref:Helicase n=1 Tax=Oryzomonas rubra TaxID=2509454 RepID=A0A5A9XRK1_9BACT|nr:DISARM system helicase DrmA [Oryzomonas rubra]KAA0895460.1 helicase [Oryzomonas rubra]